MQEISKISIAELIGKDDPVLIEIGSYDGKDGVELARQFHFPTLYCFEADPRSQQLWESFHQSSHNIRLIKSAIGNVDGHIKFNQSSSTTRKHYEGAEWSASSSIKKPASHLELFPDVEFNKTILVPCMKLDTWAMQHPEVIDFIWCDVNGGEEDVILGGLKTLQRTRFLYIEWSDKQLYEGQINQSQLMKLLPNFSLLGVYNFQGNFGNLLLKNNSL